MNFVARNIAKSRFRSPSSTERSQDILYRNEVKDKLSTTILVFLHIIYHYQIKDTGDVMIQTISLEKLPLSLEMLAHPLSPEM